ncbi:MAG: hypothetical protein EAZ61_09970 [Oscillatoriales cyanobacterium]|nr:MAG: hypothetical protein EAZ61_09970 [Oscillatoriales cyanobacterium]
MSPPAPQYRPSSYQTRNYSASPAGQQAIAIALRNTRESDIVALAQQFFYKNRNHSPLERPVSGCSIASFRRFRRGKRVRCFVEFCQALGLNPVEICAEPIAPKLLPELASQGGDRLTTAKHTVCLGREMEIGQIETALRSGSARLYIRGAQGVGKTALADDVIQTIAPNLAIARRITIAVKPYDNLGSRQIPRWRAQRSLDCIERELARACSPVLGHGAMPLPRDVLFTRLAAQPTLLVIDDLDRVDDLDAVLGLVYGLPASVQVVATGTAPLPIERVLILEPLSRPAIIQLIDHCCADRHVTLSPSDRQWLQAVTRGFPAAVIKGVALLAELDHLPRQPILHLRDNCLMSYIRLGFDRLSPDAQTVAATLSLFPQPTSLEALAEITTIPQPRLTAIVQQLHRLNLARYNTQQCTCHASRLERDHFTQALQTHPQRDTLLQRWLDRYRRRATQLTPDDWKVWQDYSSIDREWDNWLAVLEWCIHHQHYDRVCELWSGLRGYTNLRGYWQERLHWLDWVIAAAEARGDFLALAKFWRDRAWTLALTEDRHQRQQAAAGFQQAIALAQQAHAVAQAETANPSHPVDPRWLEFRAELALEQAVLCLEDQDLDGAHTRILQARADLNHLLDRDRPTASSLQWQRQSLRADYYEAEIFFNRQEYARAREAYSRVLKRARDLGWSQFCAYSTNWLADIALCEHSYEAAETWLKQTHGYLAGQRDFRSLGFYHQSLARAYAGRDRLEEAHHSARHAANAFAQVGLLDRARTLLDEFNLA